jgi:hypothetical protein
MFLWSTEQKTNYRTTILSVNLAKKISEDGWVCWAGPQHKGLPAGG